MKKIKCILIAVASVFFVVLLCFVLEYLLVLHVTQKTAHTIIQATDDIIEYLESDSETDLQFVYETHEKKVYQVSTAEVDCYVEWFAEDSIADIRFDLYDAPGACGFIVKDCSDAIHKTRCEYARDFEWNYLLVYRVCVIQIDNFVICLTTEDRSLGFDLYALIKNFGELFGKTGDGSVS